MTFSNPIVGGTTLIRPAIHSPDYVAGTSGWSINKDGTAEFNDVVFRGSAESANYVPGVSGWKLDQDGDAEFNSIEIRATGTETPITVGASTSPQVKIATTANQGAISLPTNRANENLIAGILSTTLNAGDPDEAQSLQIYGPTVDGAGDRSRLFLNSQNNDGSSEANASLTTGSSSLILDENTVTFSGHDDVITTGNVAVGGNLTANNIQKGVAAITTVAGQWAEVTVTFAHAFSATPVVVVSGNNNAPAVGGTTQLYSATTTITTTGFVLRVFRQTAIAMNFGWIAIA